MGAQTALFPRPEAGNAFGASRAIAQRNLATGAQKPVRVNPEPPATSAMSIQHLAACGSKWWDLGEPGAGWELIKQLGSADLDVRLLAAEHLAKAEHSRVRQRDLRRARRMFRAAISRNQSSERKAEKVASTNTPYGLGIIESCVACKTRKEQWFCGLSEEALRLLGGASHLTTYPGDALLFVEGQMPRGAYVVCSGKVKLSTTSKEGKVLILKYAAAGDVLGLSAVLTGNPFELTAETVGPCQLNFIDREPFIRGIEQCGELGLRTSLALSREFQSAQRDIHDLVLARSSAGKLARLLLSWTHTPESSGDSGEIRVRSTATHEQMAQMIGSSRETVTRLLGDLRKKEMIRLEGSTLVIRNISALQGLAA